MRAISLWQPWATLMALGEKTWETRPYPLPKGLLHQWIAIHATLHVERSAWSNPWIVQALARFGITEGNATGTPGYLPQRAIVAVVRFGGCSRAEDVAPELSNQELALGNYAAGRWAWQRTDLVDLNNTPVQSVNGRQRFWTLTPAQDRALAATLLNTGYRLPAELRQLAERGAVTEGNPVRAKGGKR